MLSRIKKKKTQEINKKKQRAADFSARLSRATEEFSQNNLNLIEQSLDTILPVIHLAYKKMIYKKFVQNLSQNLNLKRNVGKYERVEVYR